MIKVNFDFVFKNLDGSDITVSEERIDPQTKKISSILKAVTAYKYFSNGLLAPAFEEGEPVKKYDLAVKIRTNKIIEVDESDFMLLKRCASNTRVFTPIISAQLQKYLNSLK